MTEIATCAPQVFATCEPQTLSGCGEAPAPETGISFELKFGPSLEEWIAHGRFERREESFGNALWGMSGRHGPYIFVQPDYYRASQRPEGVTLQDWNDRPPIAALDEIRFDALTDYVYTLNGPPMQLGREITWPQGAPFPRMRADIRFELYRFRRGPLSENSDLSGYRIPDRCLPRGNADVQPPCSDIIAELEANNIPLERMVSYNPTSYFPDENGPVAWERLRNVGDLQITVEAIDIVGPPRVISLAEWQASRHRIFTAGTWPNFSLFGYTTQLPRATGLITCSDGIPNHGYIGGLVPQCNCGGVDINVEKCVCGGGGRLKVAHVGLYRFGMRGSYTGNFVSGKLNDADPQAGTYDFGASFISGQFGKHYVHRHKSIGFTQSVDGPSCGCLENNVPDGDVNGFCQYSEVNHESVTQGPYPVVFNVGGVTPASVVNSEL